MCRTVLFVTTRSSVFAHAARDALRCPPRRGLVATLACGCHSRSALPTSSHTSHPNIRIRHAEGAVAETQLPSIGVVRSRQACSLCVAFCNIFLLYTSLIKFPLPSLNYWRYWRCPSSGFKLLGFCLIQVLMSSAIV
jgi:hypothetical protein